MLTVTRLARRCGVSRSTVLHYDMKGSGFTEDQMNAWHVQFERSAPDEHQEFLQFLRIPADEIRTIRESSRKHGTKPADTARVDGRARKANA